MSEKLENETRDRLAELASALTAEQLEFANLYLTKSSHGMTDVECYQAAFPGCTKGTATVNSSRLVRHNPKVRAYLDAHNIERLADNIASLDELKVSLTEMVRADITELARWETVYGEDGGAVPVPCIRKFEDVPPELRRLIKSITYTKMGPKIEYYDKQRAMDMLIKMQGGYTERVELSGRVDGVQISAEMTPEQATDIYRTMVKGS
ncbi:terminase small subunit [Klebsiella pneumoniae]